ncbi:MAG: hypothetical protein ABIU05_03150, partial [Nitrospirales bacterium]
ASATPIRYIAYTSLNTWFRLRTLRIGRVRSIRRSNPFVLWRRHIGSDRHIRIDGGWFNGATRSFTIFWHM